MKRAAANTTKYREDKMPNLPVQDYHDYLDEILVSNEALQVRIAELGEEISRDYQGESVHLICILRGGVLFLTDLMRHITVPNTIDFMAVSSYGVNRQTTGQVRITLDLNTDIGERDVILVEDIVDSGHTIASVLDLLTTRHPKSLVGCALLDKTERLEVPIPVRYSGFSIPNKFVFGYGRDIDDYYRNLPFIGVVDLPKYEALLSKKM
jgi:hypoxanthine phosphoribosyltransferase